MTFLRSIDATGCQQRSAIDMPGSHETIETLLREVAQLGLALIEGDEPWAGRTRVRSIGWERVVTLRDRGFGLAERNHLERCGG